MAKAKQLLLFTALVTAKSILYAQNLTTKIQTYGSGENSISIEFVEINNTSSLPDTIGDPERWIGYFNYGYRISKYEITRSQISKASAQSGLNLNQADMSNSTGNADNKPTTGLSWIDAAKFVNYLNTSHGYYPAYKINSFGELELWQNGDLGYNSGNQYRNSRARYVMPSEDEWYKAAYFSTSGTTHLVYQNRDYYASGSWWDYPNETDAPPQSVANGFIGAVFSQSGPADVQESGEKSFWGTVGQGGNVWEWTETSVDHLNANPNSNRIIRGGSFLSTSSQDLCATTIQEVGPSTSQIDLGFRVVDIVPRTGTYADCSYIISEDLTSCQIVSYNGFGGQITIPTYILGVPVTSIANRAFMANSTITSIIIPDGVTTIEDYAFAGCTALVSVNLPNTLTSIGDTGFGYCRSLSTINLPASLRSIGPSALAATALYSITIPDGITTITHNMLQECPNLSSVTLPSTITSIEYGAFQVCTSLKSIILPQNLTTISNYAFNMCGLESIRIPSNVLSLGWRCFAGCQSLSNVIFDCNPPEHGWGLFQDINNTKRPLIFYNSNTTGWGSTYAERQVYPLGALVLTINYNSNYGTVTRNPEQLYYSNGDSVILTAVSRPGYQFVSWSGDLSSVNPIETIEMDNAKEITALFQMDDTDNDNDGLSNYEEITVYGTNPNMADTNSDSVTDGAMVALGYSPLLNVSSLINYLMQSLLANPNGNSFIEQIKESGRQEVLQNANNYGLYSTTQIHNLGLGGIVLDRNSNNEMVLHYQIMQSTDLQNWTPYQSYDLPITNVPNDKMFLRVQAVGQ